MPLESVRIKTQQAHGVRLRESSYELCDDNGVINDDAARNGNDEIFT